MGKAGNGFRMLPTCHPGVQAVAASSTHSFPRHTHDEFGIGVIASGAQRSASGRGQVTAEAGDLITVNPGEVHDGMPLGRAGRSWSMLYLQPALVASIRAGFAPGKGGDFEFENPALRDAPRAGAFRQAFHAITQTQPIAGGLAVEQALLALLAPLAVVGDTRHYRDAPAGLLRVKTRLDDDPSQNTALQDLANEAGLSRFQTLRAFAVLTGLTPHAYLLQRRISLARQRIAAGEALASVAAGSGYADQSHMTREFARRYGVTPAAYRRAVLPCNFLQDDRPGS